MASLERKKPMAKLDLPFLKSYKVGGRQYYYFNRRGFASVKLPGAPLSPDWMQAYNEAKDASNAGTSSPRKDLSVKPGSLADVIAKYYSSTNFLGLSKLTQSTYRNEIEKLRKEHGDKPFNLLNREGVNKLVAAKASKPGAANKVLRTIKMLIKFAIVELKLIDHDFTIGVKPLKVEGDGFVAWTERDIARFEEAFPIGTKPRLALALLLYTGQRRGDVVRMSRRDIFRDHIQVKQQKTGTALEIPIHHDLAEVLAHVTVDIPAFLLSEHGKPFAAASFGNWFGDRCRDAGLPTGHNAHGLRKAAARRLAEAGCTANEIMSITGHKTMAEVERYTRSAAQPKLAASAFAKLDAAGLK